jgi:hypothetical protein
MTSTIFRGRNRKKFLKKSKRSSLLDDHQPSVDEVLESTDVMGQAKALSIDGYFKRTSSYGRLSKRFLR